MGKYIIILAVFVIITCGDSSTNIEETFTITVFDQDGVPVEGAWVQYNSCMMYFMVSTDLEGKAEIPEWARGLTVIIYKNNYYTNKVSEIYAGDYVINSTPRNLVEIGDLIGRPEYFDDDQIITLGFEGDYHVYEYTENSIDEVLSFQLPHNVGKASISGDTLYVAWEETLFVYSIANFSTPQELYQLQFDYSFDYVRQDSILFLAFWDSLYTLKLYNLQPDSEPELIREHEISTLGLLAIRSNYLYTLKLWGFSMGIYDISDLDSIELVYTYDNYDYSKGMIKGDSLILIPRYYNLNPDDWYIYPVFSLADPSNPSFHGNLTADGSILDFVDDSLAVGYHVGGSSAIMEFDNGHFQSRAVISEDWGQFEGYYPPYFVHGEKLVRLE
ncbi:MAG: hypothetical protein GY839_14175 [candidate division Zixibacteria bacterium]|nr:hypothetical protein [candidate division Zixibacteria bacterium]